MCSKIPNFWAQSILNTTHVSPFIAAEDTEAFKYLTDFEIIRDANGDPRPAEVRFTFAENPFFANQQLVKKFTLKEGAGEYNDPEYELSQVVQTSKVTIDWKDDEHNLSKKNPSMGGREDDDFEPGSFFNIFFEKDDMEAITAIIMFFTESFWPHALDFFKNEVTDGMFPGLEFDDEDDLEDDEDDEEDEDEEDEDPNAEIDLEEPPKKKSKN